MHWGERFFKEAKKSILFSIGFQDMDTVLEKRKYSLMLQCC